MNLNLSNDPTNKVHEHWSMLVEQMQKRGKLFTTNAQDYFIITPGTFDWNNIPDFVIGRPGYDNWLVDYAFHNETISLIDATATLPAIHQTGADGNFAGHRKRPDLEWNWERGNERYDHGHTTFASWETVWRQSKDNNLSKVVSLLRRQY